MKKATWFTVALIAITMCMGFAWCDSGASITPVAPPAATSSTTAAATGQVATPVPASGDSASSDANPLVIPNASVTLSNVSADKTVVGLGGTYNIYATATVNGAGNFPIQSINVTANFDYLGDATPQTGVFNATFANVNMGTGTLGFYQVMVQAGATVNYNHYLSAPSYFVMQVVSPGDVPPYALQNVATSGDPVTLANGETSTNHQMLGIAGGSAGLAVITPSVEIAYSTTPSVTGSAVSRRNMLPAAQADLVVYNPSGPSVAFTRSWFNNQARSGVSTPGLPPGWFHTYGSRIIGFSGGWGMLGVSYLNGAAEAIVPTLNAQGVPTGAFTMVSGSPYSATGTPSTTTGQWLSITLTDKAQIQYKFTPLSTSYYVITQITDRQGNSITLNRDSSMRLTSIAQTGTGGKTLLTLSYNGSGLLSTLVDLYGRQVSYTYGTSDGISNCLLAVSQLVPTGSNSQVRFAYSYLSYQGSPLLASTSIPSPTGSGMSSTSFAYNAQGGVSQQTDPDGN
jgi:hypothetical protein